MTTRRSFLGAILALGAAPAIVRADSLMKIAVPKLWLPQAGSALVGFDSAASYLNYDVGNELWSGGFLGPLASARLDHLMGGPGLLRIDSKGRDYWANDSRGALHNVCGRLENGKPIVMPVKERAH